MATSVSCNAIHAIDGGDDGGHSGGDIGFVGRTLKRDIFSRRGTSEPIGAKHVIAVGQTQRRELAGSRWCVRRIRSDNGNHQCPLVVMFISPGVKVGVVF